MINAVKSSVQKWFRGIVFSALAGLSLVSVSAQAADPLVTSGSSVMVNVGGTNYSVTYFETGADPLNRPPNSLAYFNTTYMPWWGNQSLANQFASAVNDDLGIWKAAGNMTDAGPYFAFSWAVQDTDTNNRWWNVGMSTVSGSAAPIMLNAPIRFAVLSATAVPEIDGKLVPQVLLLLTGLFFLFRGKASRQTAGRTILEDRRLCVG
jgi:hypothetical protein